MGARAHHIESPNTLRVLTLNCWGLKYISKHRQARLREIGRQLAQVKPPLNIVGLQEVWTQEDYHAIRAATASILPYGKFYHSGFFGAGLVILSKWPIEESSMFVYPLCGRPSAFFRGDWFVGKGVACARIRLGPEVQDVVEVFCTHLHAQYEADDRDSYECHRLAETWEMAKLIRHAAERGHLAIGLGDFNSEPGSLPHRMMEGLYPIRDVWHFQDDPTRSMKSSEVTPTPSASDCVFHYGSTSDSRLNTWSWDKQTRRAMSGSKHTAMHVDHPDARAKRIDYIFFADGSGSDVTWTPQGAAVSMLMRVDGIETSLSDHFAVEATFLRVSTVGTQRLSNIEGPWSLVDYADVLRVTKAYMLRERRFRSRAMLYFQLSVAVTIACLVSIWWADRGWLAFLLALISGVGLCSGVLAGLIGGLFVKQEIRALKEFTWEVETARKLAAEGEIDVQ